MSQVELVGRDTGLVGYNTLNVTANGHVSSLPNVKFNAAQFTLANGAQTEFQCNQHGSLKVTQAPTKTILSVGDNVTIANGAATASFDLRTFSKVRIYGNVSQNKILLLQYSDDNANFKFIDSLVSMNDTDGNIVINHFIDCPPNYVRIHNASGVSLTVGMRIVGLA